MHAPEHCPPVHCPLAQATAGLHAPVASQVSTPLAEHWVDAGAHDPEHDPATQVWGAQGAGLPKWPVASHV